MLQSLSTVRLSKAFKNSRIFMRFALHLIDYKFEFIFNFRWYLTSKMSDFTFDIFWMKELTGQRKPNPIAPTIKSFAFISIGFMIRSSHWRCSIQKDVKKFCNIQGKHLCQGLFFNKTVGLRHWHRCFSVNFANFLRTRILKNICQWLLF